MPEFLKVRITRGGGGGSSPLDLPLVQASDNIFTRIGQINLTYSDPFSNGGGGLSINGNQMYMGGLRTAGTVGRYQLPASIGGTASIALAPVSVSGSWGPTQSSIVTGTLVYNGNLYIARSVDYDANGDQSGWIKVANLNVGGQGSVCTMSGSGIAVRRLSQGMGHIPSEWQSILGGPCFTTGCRMSIVTQAQCGYGFAVFDPANVSAGGGSVPVIPLLDYYAGSNTNAATALEPVQGHHISQWNAYPKNASGGTDLYSVTNAFLATAFIAKGSRSLLFVTVHGFGVADNGCRPGSSVNNSPFRVQVVAYDLVDLVAVKNGTSLPYQPRPYAWWVLPGWDTPYGACLGNPSSGSSPGNGCYDPATDRLYLLCDGTGGFPALDPLQVWSVASR